jgi:hypothetical protein
MVIRSETRRVDGSIDGLVYRVADIGPFLNADLVEVAAATDRMPYETLLAPDGDIERHRVVLTMEQVTDRLGAGDRQLGDLDYVPRKIDLRDNQIFQILAMSARELGEVRQLSRDRLRDELLADIGDALRLAAIDQLQFELSRDPTEPEIAGRLEELINLLVEPLLPARFRAEVDRRLTFDLEPHEFADLQDRGVLVLGRDHLEIRETRRGTVYYRDYEQPFEPGVSADDNLLSLPRYAHADA